MSASIVSSSPQLSELGAVEQLPEIYAGEDGRQAQPAALSVEGLALSHTLYSQECARAWEAPAWAPAEQKFQADERSFSLGPRTNGKAPVGLTGLGPGPAAPPCPSPPWRMGWEWSGNGEPGNPKQHRGSSKRCLLPKHKAPGTVETWGCFLGDCGGHSLPHGHHGKLSQQHPNHQDVASGP